jgi:glycosyltransferase involved in cell wall biosynthesis
MARFFGKRPVLHFVSAEIEPLLERYRRWLIPVLRLADTAVVGSRYLQKVLGRIGVPVRMVTQPVALDGITHQVRRKLQPKILVSTSLEPDLNVQLAIKAFRLVKQKYPRCELVVVGDGSERVRLEQLVARHRLFGVEFKGALEEAESVQMYQQCDLFLHAPLVDESPIALVRALAAGLPVVTSDADGITHMVRDRVNALIVPMGDHVGLADAVIELVENQELCERLSAQGRAEAEKYVWARVRQDWVNLYKGMVT